MKIILLFLIAIFTVMPLNKAMAGWPDCTTTTNPLDLVFFCIPAVIVSAPLVIVGSIIDGDNSEPVDYKSNEEQRTISNNNLTNKAPSLEPLRPYRRDDEPPFLSDLTNLRKENTVVDTKGALPLDIRGDAIKEAALSFGARGGLAWRTWQIRQELDGSARYMDKIYNFRQLLIPAPSGLLIEPPIISEAMDAVLIDNQGMDVALADRVLNINKNARIVTAPRTWRFYLERDWGSEDVTPPPDILRPSNPDERARWKRYVTEGWNKGVEQANEVFQADLNRLTADFKGMVRYRELLAQGMVSPPYTAQTYRGVTGDGDTMRVGDRALEITELPQLQTGSDKWQPASR